MGLFGGKDKTTYKKVKEEGCVITFSVEVPSSFVQDESHNMILRFQQRAKLPGFRPGKAPLDLVKSQLSGHARDEVVESLIRKYVPEGLRELGLRPVASPAVESVDFAEGKPLRLRVRVEVPPQVAPRDYTRLALTRKRYPATEEELAKRLEELREANARLEKVSEEAAAKEHYVVIDYQAFSDGKSLPKAKGSAELVDMSSDQTLEGLSEGLVGAKRGETREIPVKINGKDALLKATVQEIKRKILPPLDAELAKDLGFTTLDELKAKLREVIEEEGRHKSERELAAQLEEALVKANRIPLPPSLVSAQLEHMLDRLRQQILGPRGQWSDKQAADLKEKLRPKAEDELRLSYLLPAIAEREKIKAEAADVEAELDRNLSSAQDDAKKAEIRKLFEERRDSIEGMIRDRKALAFVREKAVITDA